MLRIGINLGDVDGRGQVISMATASISRPGWRPLAEPGGICVSGTAYDQVRNKVEAAFEDLGDQNLKNIAEPVRIYRVAGTPRVCRSRRRRARAASHRSPSCLSTI